MLSTNKHAVKQPRSVENAPLGALFRPFRFDRLGQRSFLLLELAVQLLHLGLLLPLLLARVLPTSDAAVDVEITAAHTSGRPCGSIESKLENYVKLVNESLWWRLPAT